MEEIFYKIKNGYRVDINGRKLLKLHLSDDSALVTETREAAHTLIEHLTSNRIQTLFQINVTKTNITINSDELSFEIGGDLFE